MRFRSAFPHPLLTVLLGAFLIAACGASPGSTGQGAQAPAATGEAPTQPDGASSQSGGATAPVASTGAGPAVDACSLLTAADIEEITGFAVATVIPNPPDTIFPSACEWRVQGAAWQVVLGVSSPGGRVTWDSLVPYTQGDPVTGIGDAAFLAEMGGDLMVRRGDTFIDVQYVAVGEPEGTQDRLAKRVLEHLP